VTHDPSLDTASLRVAQWARVERTLDEEHNAMRYRAILPAGPEPSVICLGTADLGSRFDRDASFQMMDLFVELGGNFVDTANNYANWLPGERSISEKTIGQWMALRGNRDRIFLATKGAHPREGKAQRECLRRADIMADLEDSLKNLRTDRIDLYWLHRDAPDHPVEEILETLNEQANAGKIRGFGCSNWQTPRMRAARTYAAQQGLRSFVANQPLWNIGVVDLTAFSDRTLTQMDDAMWDFHRATGLPAVPYASQANGFFHKLAQGKTDRIGPQTHLIYKSPANQQRLRRVLQVAEETGFSVTQIVLGYLLGQPFPTFPIVGCQSLDQLKDSMTAGDVQLTARQVESLSPDPKGESPVPPAKDP
jgi:aryl-alcohol dehydrogenase-like predicted oxidoreductase